MKDIYRCQEVSGKILDKKMIEGKSYFYIPPNWVSFYTINLEVLDVGDSIHKEKESMEMRVFYNEGNAYNLKFIYDLENPGK